MAETGGEDKAAAIVEETGEAVSAATVRGITLHGFGGLRMVNVQKREVVWPKEGEVLIRVKACGLNFTDLMVRQGAIDNPPKVPFVMGFECAGEVEAIGEAVDDLKIGDRVIAVTDYRAWSESVCMPAQTVYKMPSGMNFPDGAALFMNYVTAYILLFEIGHLRPGQSVLVHSAGGGVGSALCQLCKTVEGITVFGTASTQKHEALKDKLDHVYDHAVDYSQEIRKIQPEGVDVVLDCLCGEDTNKGISILKPLGRYVLFGSSNVVTGETKSFFSFAKSWWHVDKISPIKLYDENKIIAGFHLRELLFKQKQYDLVRRVMNTLLDMYTANKLRPLIDSVWAFDDVIMAMQRMHDRANVGKIILDPSLPSKEQETVHLNLTLVTLQCQSQGDAANTSTDAPGDPPPQSASDVNKAGEE